MNTTYGRQLFEYQKTYDDAISSYEEAVESLDRHRRELRNARNRYDSDNLSNEDRENARQDIAHHRREIERLDYDLPLMEADIDRAGRQLDDYRSYLQQLGRL